ncbi:hypothetical protein BROUX41_003874 [Berkeleyomyces rouxiae]|uniref:uncharacterized protein n=1 Tax=Berkeleyomyces rouxiae TaxID=2035830 RepID=UPI003B77DB57
MCDQIPLLPFPGTSTSALKRKLSPSANDRFQMAAEIGRCKRPLNLPPGTPEMEAAGPSRRVRRCFPDARVMRENLPVAREQSHYEVKEYVEGRPVACYRPRDDEDVDLDSEPLFDYRAMAQNLALESQPALDYPVTPQAQVFSGDLTVYDYSTAMYEDDEDEGEDEDGEDDALVGGQSSFDYQAMPENNSTVNPTALDNMVTLAISQDSDGINDAPGLMPVGDRTPTAMPNLFAFESQIQAAEYSPMPALAPAPIIAPAPRSLSEGAVVPLAPMPSVPSARHLNLVMNNIRPLNIPSLDNDEIQPERDRSVSARAGSDSHLGVMGGELDEDEPNGQSGDSPGLVSFPNASYLEVVNPAITAYWELPRYLQLFCECMDSLENFS